MRSIMITRTQYSHVHIQRYNAIAVECSDGAKKCPKLAQRLAQTRPAPAIWFFLIAEFRFLLCTLENITSEAPANLSKSAWRKVSNNSRYSSHAVCFWNCEIAAQLTNDLSQEILLAAHRKLFQPTAESFLFDLDIWIVGFEHLGLHHSTACKAEELTATIQPGLHHTAMKWLFLASESLLCGLFIFLFFPVYTSHHILRHALAVGNHPGEWKKSQGESEKEKKDVCDHNSIRNTHTHTHTHIHTHKPTPPPPPPTHTHTDSHAQLYACVTPQWNVIRVFYLVSCHAITASSTSTLSTSPIDF